MKVSLTDVWNQMRRMRLELGEVDIIDETHGFGRDFVEKTYSGLKGTSPDIRAVL